MRDFDDYFKYFPKGSYRAAVDKNGNYYPVYDECRCNDSLSNTINNLAFGFGFNNPHKSLVEDLYMSILDRIRSDHFMGVHHILVNGEVTTFIWEDGTHTIVKLAEGDEFDIDTAYCYAIVKKMTGNTSGSMKRYFDKLHKKTIVKQEKSSPLYDKLKDLLKYLKKD